jgi:uncharacterized protein
MRVWIDLDNSPHVLFFKPIIARLEQEKVETLVTIRDFSQTEDLAKQHGLRYRVVGKHRTHKLLIARAGETLCRALQLAMIVKKEKPTAAISHGSRALVLAARALGIPSMTLYDYEFVSASIFNKLSTKVLAPAILQDRLVGQGLDVRKFTGYPGLKEDVYVHECKPNPTVLSDLGLDSKRLIVTVRPPANWAHYHSSESESLFTALIERLRREPNAQVVIIPRTQQQRLELLRTHRLDEEPFIVVDRAVDGLSLMWYSDAVFSGGGTMVREAALLGAKVYSTFAGRMGGADQYLVSQGRLAMISSAKDLEHIIFSKRILLPESKPSSQFQTRDFVCSQIVSFAGRRVERSALPG